MTDGEVFTPTTGTWVRRASVLVLVGMAGVLILGPVPAVVTKGVGPVLLLIVWRNFQRTLQQNQRTGRAPKPMSKRGYAIMATLIVGLMSLPLWLLCDRALVAITLVPALVCIWFATYLFRET